jgi:hypothetical protein
MGLSVAEEGASEAAALAQKNAHLQYYSNFQDV